MSRIAPYHREMGLVSAKDAPPAVLASGSPCYYEFEAPYNYLWTERYFHFFPRRTARSGASERSRSIIGNGLSKWASVNPLICALYCQRKNFSISFEFSSFKAAISDSSREILSAATFKLEGDGGIGTALLLRYLA